MSKVRGTTLQIELDGRPVRVSVGEDIKLSLRTRDTAEAKRRHASVLAQVNAHWDAVRAGPKPLSHKDTLALAGEIYRTFIDVLDEDPGSPELWERVMETDRAVLQPQPSALQSLMVGKQAQSTQIDPQALETRFGGFVDVILQRHRVVTDEASRQKLMIEFGKALIEAARINKQKAEGDYSESGETKRYPEFKREAAKPEIAATPGIGLTFDQIIDAEIKRRATGRGGKPMDKRSVDKYRRAAADFVKFRGSPLVASVTPREAEAWLDQMLDEGSLSQNSVRQRLMNLKTVIEWGRKQALGDLFPAGHPLQLVQPPVKQDDVPQGERSYTLQEARTVLLAARNETNPDRRWLPWLPDLVKNLLSYSENLTTSRPLNLTNLGMEDLMGVVWQGLASTTQP
nr:DUF6538 domain-containing protein [Rhodobacter sp. JA431]